MIVNVLMNQRSDIRIVYELQNLQHYLYNSQIIQGEIDRLFASRCARIQIVQITGKELLKKYRYNRTYKKLTTYIKVFFRKALGVTLVYFLK